MLSQTSRGQEVNQERSAFTQKKKKRKEKTDTAQIEDLMVACPCESKLTRPTVKFQDK